MTLIGNTGLGSTSEGIAQCSSRSIVVLLADNAMSRKNLFSACRFHAARWISALPGNIRGWAVT
jgi:hypothetical protein